MGSFFGAIGRRGNDPMEQMIQSIMGQRVQDYYRTKEEKGRQAKVSSAISGLYGFDPATAGQMTTLAAAGMAPSGEFIAGKQMEPAINKWLGTLDPATRGEIELLPKAQQGELMTKDMTRRAKAAAREAAYESFMKVSGEIPRKSDGLPDLSKFTDTQAIAFVNSFYAMMPEGMGEEQIKRWTNFAMYRQLTDPTKTGKEDKLVLGQTEKQISRMMVQYDLYEWGQIPPEDRTLIREAFGIKGPEDWDNHRGQIPVFDKALTTAEAQIKQTLTDMLPMTLKDNPSEVWSQWRAGKLKGPLLEYLESNFSPNSPWIPRMDVTKQKAIEISDAMAELSKSVNLPEWDRKLYSDLYTYYNLTQGQTYMATDLYNYMMKKGYDVKQLEKIKDFYAEHFLVGAKKETE